MSDFISRNNKLSIIEKLKGIFDNVNKWLIFAESKNTALLGINGLLLFRMFDYYDNIDEYILNVRMVGILLITFTLSLGITLLSFFPNCSKLVQRNDNTIENTDETKNLIFYIDIGKYENAKFYLKDIYKYYHNNNIEIEELDKYELDYAEEIIINSKIATYKFKMFGRSLKLNIIGIALLIIFYIVT